MPIDTDADTQRLRDIIGVNRAIVKRWVKVDHEIDNCVECGEGEIHIYSDDKGILKGSGICEPENRRMDYPFNIPDWCPKKVK
jgi:hypothetical protein